MRSAIPKAAYGIRMSKIIPRPNSKIANKLIIATANERIFGGPKLMCRIAFSAAMYTRYAAKHATTITTR